jgi:uncharacterized protein YkwD
MQDLRPDRHKVPDLDSFGFRPLTNPTNFPQLEHRSHHSTQPSRPKSSSSSSSTAGAGAAAAAVVPKRSTATSQDDNEFYRESLQVHNELRRNHGVEPLRLNNELCKLAQQWGK